MAANDVKWSHGRFESTIATAAANGQIVVYDINRPGVELARLHEHNRQVHRVAFNPHQGALLLSGSQDATIRLWDLRDVAGDRSVMTCRSRYKYPGNNEGIRDLKWSPTNGVEFAAATDNGVIQRWDFRRDNAPLLKINAHEKTCHSIDWHPDGKHLASGGADKNMKVWDFSSTDRRMKSCWQLRAPKGILNVRWRPACWVSGESNIGSWQCTQLATSYDHQDSRIHVWDLRRPFMPFREIDRYDTAPTAMLWHSENLLWTVGVAGMFTQTDMNFAPKVSDRRSLNVATTAPNGQISFFFERRGRRRRSFDYLVESIEQRKNESRTSGERLGGSHSAAEGSLEEPSLLSSSFKNRHRRPPSTRSSKSLASTPPSTSTGGPIVRLDEALQDQNLYHPTQVAAHGRIAGLFDTSAFIFLARHYRLPTLSLMRHKTLTSPRDLSDMFKANAKLATYASRYREAQSWRILSSAVERAFKSDLIISRPNQIISVRNHTERHPHLSTRTPTVVFGSSPHKKVLGAISSKAAVPSTLDNWSNMTTPIARPVSDPSIQTGAPQNIYALGEEESLQLPGPAWDKRPQTPQAHVSSELGKLMMSSSVGEKAHGDEKSIDDLDKVRQNTQRAHAPVGSSSPLLGFPDIEATTMARRAAIDNYRAKPRTLVQLDQPIQSLSGNLLAPRLDRHDSNESFQNAQMFSVSEGSSLQVDSTPGSFDVTNSFESVEEPPRSDSMSDFYSDTREHDYDSQELILKSEADHKGGFSRGRVTPNLLPSSSHTKSPASANTYICSDPDLEVLFSTSAISPPILRPSDPKPPIINYEDTQYRQNTTESKARNEVETAVDDLSAKLLPQTSESSNPVPWTINAMLEPLITYYTTDLSSVQLPTQLLLTLAPHISHSIPSALMLSVLLTYHSQLTSLSLFCQAAHIRNLAQNHYPDVSDHGAYGITPGGPWCTVCQKPNKGDRLRFCERCKQPWGPCPICDGEGLSTAFPQDYSDKAMNDQASKWLGAGSLWAWCQGCGHGGHVGCLQLWWDDASISEGGCATDGCLHDCVMGERRDEALKQMGENKKAGIVRGDEWIVGESRAVEEARGLVVSANTGRHSDRNRGTLQRQYSPRGLGAKVPSRGNLGPRTGSGGKKVRLVVPEDEGEARASKGDNTMARTSASAP